MHSRFGHRDLSHCANSDDDANARGVHNAYAHDDDARNGHADCYSKSERNRDRHGDGGPQPTPDLDGESNPEHRADGNTESQSDSESYADAGAHPDENAGAHINAHKSAGHPSADAITDNDKIAVIGTLDLPLRELGITPEQPSSAARAHGLWAASRTRICW